MAAALGTRLVATASVIEIHDDYLESALALVTLHELEHRLHALVFGLGIFEVGEPGSIPAGLVLIAICRPVSRAPRQRRCWVASQEAVIRGGLP